MFFAALAIRGVINYYGYMETQPDIPSTESFIYMVGIKGSGMAALAQLLSQKGYRVTGSDTHETFFTDELLAKNNIPFIEGFNKKNIPLETGLVIYSAAYNTQTHPELRHALAAGLPCMEYTKALGLYSAAQPSLGIAGVHGKTTTTAMAGLIMKESGLPGSVLTGSVVPGFGDSAVCHTGDRFFIAETCEYRRHFLDFNPTVLLVTNIEEDHLDYFTDADDIFKAFCEYTNKLPEHGCLVYCADDPGSSKLAQWTREQRPDVHLVPYGEMAHGEYRITNIQQSQGTLSFFLGDAKVAFKLTIPGRHNIKNAAGALAAVKAISEAAGLEFTMTHTQQAKTALRQFTGTKRRSEILGEAGGVLFIDDYAHHPTAIRTTLEGFRDFYPHRRIVCDFMSHTYTRTDALLEEFARSFEAAGAVVLHKIYASARESYDGTVSGRTLYEKTIDHHDNVMYFHEPDDAVDHIRGMLRENDIFITMGAGDNWRIGKKIHDSLKEKNS